jgi:hypothetical protein
LISLISDKKWNRLKHLINCTQENADLIVSWCVHNTVLHLQLLSPPSIKLMKEWELKFFGLYLNYEAKQVFKY